MSRWGRGAQSSLTDKQDCHPFFASVAMIDPDVIIAGDFNTTEAEMEALAEEVGMVLMIPAGQDGQGTTHANNRYDHFLISFDLADEEALSSRIITYGGAALALAAEVSDHLPVQATGKGPRRNNFRFRIHARKPSSPAARSRKPRRTKGTPAVALGRRERI